MGLSRTTQPPKDRISITISPIKRPRDLDPGIFDRREIPHSRREVKARARNNHSPWKGMKCPALDLPNEWIGSLQKIGSTDRVQSPRILIPDQPLIENPNTLHPLPVIPIKRHSFIPLARDQVIFPRPQIVTGKDPESIPLIHINESLYEIPR